MMGIWFMMISDYLYFQEWQWIFSESNTFYGQTVEGQNSTTPADDDKNHDESQVNLFQFP